MTNMIQAIFRLLVLAVLAIAGFALAAVFMFSTALVVGFLYLRAKITGKPFLGQALWAQRRSAGWGMPRRPGTPGNAPGAQPARPRVTEVIDVEAREIR